MHINFMFTYFAYFFCIFWHICAIEVNSWGKCIYMHIYDMLGADISCHGSCDGQGRERVNVLGADSVL